MHRRDPVSVFGTFCSALPVHLPVLLHPLLAARALQDEWAKIVQEASADTPSYECGSYRKRQTEAELDASRSTVPQYHSIKVNSGGGAADPSFFQFCPRHAMLAIQATSNCRQLALAGKTMEDVMKFTMGEDWRTSLDERHPHGFAMPSKDLSEVRLIGLVSLFDSSGSKSESESESESQSGECRNRSRSSGLPKSVRVLLGSAGTVCLRLRCVYGVSTV